MVPRTLERPTEEIESSSWPTPTVNGNYNRKGASTNSGDGLETAVKMWPTPQAHDAQKGYAERVGRFGTKHGGRNLNDWVLWPTPQARDYRSGDAPDSPRAKRKREQGWSPNLNDTVLWPTPAAQDGKNSTLPPSQKDRDTVPGAVMRSGQTGQLNPDWVECLMGFPIGWTSIDGPLDSEKRSLTGSRRESLVHTHEVVASSFHTQ
nr:hypothetical protein [Alicyclobacillus shizuokensis]